MDHRGAVITRQDRRRWDDVEDPEEDSYRLIMLMEEMTEMMDGHRGGMRNDDIGHLYADGRMGYEMDIEVD
ncbi:hypothetical protein Tco_0450390 [Tanacetum coccineum]